MNRIVVTIALVTLLWAGSATAEGGQLLINTDAATFVVAKKVSTEGIPVLAEIHVRGHGVASRVEAVWIATGTARDIATGVARSTRLTEVDVRMLDTDTSTIIVAPTPTDGPTWVGIELLATEDPSIIAIAYESDSMARASNSAILTDEGGVALLDPSISIGIDLAPRSLGRGVGNLGESGDAASMIAKTNSNPDGSRSVDETSLHVAPSPFNPLTRIDFRGRPGFAIAVKAFDVRGRLVSTLHEGVATGRIQSVVWDARELPSGVYFVRVDAGESQRIVKTTLLK